MSPASGDRTRHIQSSINHFLFNRVVVREIRMKLLDYICVSHFPWMLVLITLCSSSSHWSTDVCRDTMEFCFLCHAVKRKLMGRMSRVPYWPSGWLCLQVFSIFLRYSFSSLYFLKLKSEW
jgi:hypothetical protein